MGQVCVSSNTFRILSMVFYERTSGAVPYYYTTILGSCEGRKAFMNYAENGRSFQVRFVERPAGAWLAFSL